jgi:nucleoid-associated protein YgaU
LGAIYLTKPGIDWQQKFGELQEWLFEPAPLNQARTAPLPATVPPSFDIASVDDTGKLVVAGRAEAGWTVRVGSATLSLGETKADEDGEWVLTPEQSLTPGEHILSLVAVDSIGKRSVPGQRTIALSVAPRREIERKSTRAQPPAVLGGAEDGTSLMKLPKSASIPENCAVAVVKQGDTLWQLAHQCYGNGQEYQKIVRSNQTQIKNPNLIYPDQHFEMPH